jgi:hypothetical protein
LVFTWIEECKDGHIKCQQHQTLLPKRVIDVWEDTPVLIDSQGRDAPYILLSHCWGGEQTITTTQSTLLERQQGIPISTLPKTFQDAVTITRTLGIQYLWIDSLCIIQDLEEDWVSESGNMKDYYRNGYLTISALYSPNSHHGILKPRQDISSVQLSPTTNLYLRPRLPDHQEVFRNAPLNNRAWALQERLLSTRILHYTDTEMFWECQTCSSRESSNRSSTVKTDPDSVITSEGEDFKRVLFNLNDDPYSAIDGAYVTWYRLVTNYSTRAITYSSDKLPAISGLASLIQSKIGATYLHGIWKEDVRSLLWFRDYSRPDTVAQQSANPALPRSEPPPSWSWASAPGPIRYRYEEAIYSGHEAVILEQDFSNLSSQSLDPISYRHLVLRARSRRLIYQLEPRNKRQSVRAALYEDGAGSNSRLFVGQGYMDFEDRTYQDSQIAPIQSCTALWIIEQRGDPYKTLVPTPHGREQEKIEYIKNLTCLLVEKVGGEQSWRRIGVGIITDAFHGDGKWSEKNDFAII